MNQAQDIMFNIYNPVITYEHRAAYDMIVSQLQEIFPICNQGKCKALEVTDDPQKQKQINDLMEKVEFFSDSLINITKVFSISSTAPRKALRSQFPTQWRKSKLT